MKFNDFLDNLFNNWQAKLVSFGLALLLYFGFQITSLSTKEFSIPLEIEEVNNYILTGTSPSVIRIEATGTNEEIAALRKENFHAFVDSSYVTKSGESRLPVHINLLNDAAMSSTLDIKIYPDMVNLTFEENSIKWVPIIPLFMGVPSEGYQQTNWSCEPSDIKISGPKTIIEATSFIYADSVDLNNKTTSFSTQVYPTNQNNRIKIDSPTDLIISVEIEPQIIKNQYTITIPTTTLSDKFIISEQIPSITLELSGEKNFLSRYYPSSEVLSVDFSSITEPGTYTLPVIVKVLPMYTLESIDTTEITVEIIEAPEPITTEEDQEKQISTHTGEQL